MESRRADLESAGQVLKDGGLVAFPTETVYGLGANALDFDAACKIYEAKGRPSDNPLIVHIAEIEKLPLIAREIPKQAIALAKEYWPGPLTMIFPKTKLVPAGVTGGLDSVAVRMPNHPVALELIKAAGGFVAAPSANTSGKPSPTSAKHVIEDLSEKVDVVVDGGDVTLGLESTIIDFSGEKVAILRPGYITKEMIETIIGEVSDDANKNIDKANIAPKAPGMKYRHYAPKAPLYIVEGDDVAVIREIKKRVQTEVATGESPGIICPASHVSEYPQGIVKSLGDVDDEAGIARRLYGVLREFDEVGVTNIYSENFNTPKLGVAIMNRLYKAAGHKIIKV